MDGKVTGTVTGSKFDGEVTVTGTAGRAAGTVTCSELYGKVTGTVTGSKFDGEVTVTGTAFKGASMYVVDVGEPSFSSAATDVYVLFLVDDPLLDSAYLWDIVLFLEDLLALADSMTEIE